MANPHEGRRNNPAQIRGDISRNQADKRPGFDPASAPLETDSEAGGNPLLEEEVELSRESQRVHDAGENPESLSYGSAMRQVDPAAAGSPASPTAGRGRLFAVLAVVAVGILILLALL